MVLTRHRLQLQGGDQRRRHPRVDLPQGEDVRPGREAQKVPRRRRRHPVFLLRPSRTWCATRLVQEDRHGVRPARPGEERARGGEGRRGPPLPPVDPAPPREPGWRAAAGAPFADSLFDDGHGNPIPWLPTRLPSDTPVPASAGRKARASRFDSDQHRNDQPAAQAWRTADLWFPYPGDGRGCG